MNVIQLKTPGVLSPAPVLEALKILRERDAIERLGVDFVELQFAPDVQEMRAAHFVAHALQEVGVGCSLRVHWGFRGTRHWALQTDRSRVVSEVP